MTARGIRLNNPGNIKLSKTIWKGQVVPGSDDQFCEFDTPEDGLRALMITLKNYQVLHGINTISGAIDRWAPPSENDTEAYKSDVCNLTGCGPDEYVNLSSQLVLIPLTRAIVHHENGSDPYTDNQLAQAAASALSG